MTYTHFEFETEIDGNPCIVKVEDYINVKGSYSYDAPSDQDYYGFTEWTASVTNLDGSKCDWCNKNMEKLLNDAVLSYISTGDI